MSKKIISKWLLVLGLSAIYTVNTFGATVSDVQSTHWAYKAIVDIKDRGYMSLNSTGNFFPNSTMNYFEVADVLAKATGYVDVQINTNIDQTFKNQIIANYEKQKSTLATYAKKYSAWDKSYDQQVAYLLGRGYLSTADLDKFVTSAGKATITKQDLAVYIVRLLGKEVTAKNTYTTTGYTDESSIKEANRPHVAYLKSLGLISGTGAFNPNTTVTKALCAKMFSDALVYKESLSNNSSTSTNTAKTEEVTVKKVLTKNPNEYYVSLLRGSNTSYYTIKNTVQVLDANGNTINIADVPVGSKAMVTITLENNTDYITSMRLINTSSDTTNNTSSDTTNNTTNNTTTGTTNNPTTLQTVSGTLTETSSNGILRVTLADGTIKVYIVDVNCVALLNGVSTSADEIGVGSHLILTIQDNMVLKIQATGNTATNATNLTSGEVVGKTFTTKGYEFKLKNGTSEADITVPSSAIITRNGKNGEVANIRLGDTLSITKANDVITEIKATGTKKSIEGTINSIHISKSPTITLKTSKGLETYAVGSDVEYYDQKSKKYISIRDLHLGQSLDVVLDSKEIISVDVINTSAAANYKAVISEIGRGYSYIDVVVDYDPITGESQVPKRIYTPIDLSITLNGKTQSRSTLKEGMELVITYEYLDDTAPQKILILD